MTEMVNSGSLNSFRDDRPQGDRKSEAKGHDANGTSATAADTPPISATGSTSPRAPTIVSSSGSDTSGSPEFVARPSPSMPPTLTDADTFDLSHSFVVDSFNIHRLVIAGVTCASKFFSDVFYTNSRYAKVRSHKDCVLRMLTISGRRIAT